MKKKEILISVDIESDGPIPGDYSMISFGACLVDDVRRTFYRELQPISDNFIPEALAVSGLDRELLKQKGVAPARAMTEFTDWINKVCNFKDKPVFVGFNATFDWMFTDWYFHHFIKRNPFGISGLDIKAYYMGGMQRETWSDTAKRNIPQRFMSRKRHTHNALDDAVEQAELFNNIRAEVLNNRVLAPTAKP